MSKKQFYVYVIYVDGVVRYIAIQITFDNHPPSHRSHKWTLAFGNHDRTPIHGYEATHEAAMVAFAKSWRRK